MADQQIPRLIEEHTVTFAARLPERRQFPVDGPLGGFAGSHIGEENVALLVNRRPFSENKTIRKLCNGSTAFDQGIVERGCGHILRGSLVCGAG